MPRLPGFVRWIIDDGYCGSISLRFQKGTSALPSHVLGHVGYAIVPRRRGAGHASNALALIVRELPPFGLDRILLTTDPGNIASIRVIEKNAGELLGDSVRDASYGHGAVLTYAIPIPPAAPKGN